MTTPASEQLQKAEDLVRLLDWMTDTRTFSDRASLQRMEDLCASLRPAWEYFLGAFPLINVNEYPPRVWFPRIRDKATVLLAHLRANPDWGPTTRRGLLEELGWIHPPLLDHLLPVIKNARETGSEMEWGRVTREAVLYLEDEIRTRTKLATRSRAELGAAAFKVGGPLQFKEDAGWQESWMHYVKGILGAFGNPAAHALRSHAEAFAMGIVGAVSVVLVRLDDAFGPPTTA